MARETALRLPLSELADAEYFKPEEEFRAGFALTKSNFRAARVLVWGNVVKAFDSGESEKVFKGIELDDFSECLSCLAFEEKAGLLNGIKAGDVVEVMGKVRQGQRGNFIWLEFVRRLSPAEELKRRLENLLSLKRLPAAKMEETESLVERSLEIEKNVL
jgi:RPA family protein